MSRIEQLIAELCPDGVEFKELGKIVKISNGKDHKHLENGRFPVYGSGGIMRYANHFIYDEESVLIPRKMSSKPQKRNLNYRSKRPKSLRCY